MKKLPLYLALLLAATAGAQTLVTGPTKIVGPTTLPAAAAGGPSFSQAGTCTGGGSTCTIALTITTGHSLVVIEMGGNTDTLSAPTDTVNTYTSAIAQVNYAGAVASIGYYISSSVTGGSLTITCHDTGLATLICFAFDVGAGAIAFDQTTNTNSGGTATTAWTTGATGTTTAATEIAIACGQRNGVNVVSAVAGGSWTIPTFTPGGSQVAEGAVCEYQNLTSTGTVSGNATVGSAQNYLMVVGTFKL